MTDSPAEAPQLSTPLSVGVDLTPGPDGTPWIRVQVATLAVGSVFSFPVSHAGAVSDALVNGIQTAAETAERESLPRLDVYADMPDAVPMNRAARRHPHG